MIIIEMLMNIIILTVDLNTIVMANHFTHHWQLMLHWLTPPQLFLLTILRSYQLVTLHICTVLHSSAVIKIRTASGNEVKIRHCTQLWLTCCSLSSFYHVSNSIKDWIINPKLQSRDGRWFLDLTNIGDVVSVSPGCQVCIWSL